MTISNRFESHKRLLMAYGFFLTLAAFSTSTQVKAEMVLLAQGMWKDPTTGLIWDRCSLGQKWDGNSCVGDAIEVDWETAKDLSQKHQLGGHSDWSLPSVAELHTLVYCSQGFEKEYTIPATPFSGDFLTGQTCKKNSSNPAIDTAIFFMAANLDYWSSTTRSLSVALPDLVWSVMFDGGYAYALAKWPKKSVRLVRRAEALSRESFLLLFGKELKSDELEPSFVKSLALDESDAKLMQEGMWKDPATGLIWDRCSFGQVWSGSTCDGTANRYNWSEANDALKNYNLGGYNDWQLPTVMQLRTLVQCNLGFHGEKNIPAKPFSGDFDTPDMCKDGSSIPSLNTSIFPNTPTSFYWSSVPDDNRKNGSWGVLFNYGSSYVSDASILGRIRAVRGTHSANRERIEELFRQGSTTELPEK